ncbi:MAG: DNA polymerase III subunit delta', partial [Sphingomicrobium sp.]
MIIGQDRAVDQFASAWATRQLHHAWLLAGPKGVGKASFAAAAARRVLAEAAGPGFDLAGLESPPDHPMVRLVDAGSHPDMRLLERLPHEKTGIILRNITIQQVRALGEFMGLSAAMSDWRVAIIDSLDDLEKAAANALLK